MGETAKATAKAPEAKRENSASQAKKTNFSKPTNPPVDHILFLQRTVGNQAVQGLLKSGVIQARLTIGQPGDIYEQEADRVAEQVMHMPDLSKAQRKGVSKDNQFPSIQRMCTECEEEVHRQKNNLELGYSELGHSSEVKPHKQTEGIQVQRMCSEFEERLIDSVGAASSRDSSRQDGAPTSGNDHALCQYKVIMSPLMQSENVTPEQII